MAVIANLAQFKRQKEVEWKRDISWQEIMDGANISRNTLARLLSGKAQRVDNETADGLCAFFKVPLGPVPFIVYNGNSFFEWLQTQVGRDDPIGDFADDTMRKSKETGNMLPKKSIKSEEWVEYLAELIHVDRAILEAFQEAWLEWCGERINLPVEE